MHKTQSITKGRNFFKNPSPIATWPVNNNKIQVFRHPDFIDDRIEFVSGEVGEGGDHANITLKNVSEAEVCRLIRTSDFLDYR